MKTKVNIDPALQTGRAGSFKHCPGCNKMKTKRSFNKDRRTKDGYSRNCRRCRIKGQRLEKAKYLRKVDALKKGAVCAKCGEERLYMLDFHHVDPTTKVDSVSAMRTQRRPLSIIKAEIKKCVPLCANHHRELHSLKLTTEQYLKETQ